MLIRASQTKEECLGQQTAYSVVEMLIAVVVLGIMFVSLYSGMSSGFAVVQLARENLRATQIMQEKMETIRLYTWDQINTPGFIPTNFVENFYAISNKASGISYTGAVTIASAPVTESYSNELRTVRIDLNWKSANVLRKRQITTFVTRNGLQAYIY